MKCVCGFTQKENFPNHKVKLITNEQWYSPEEKREMDIFICPNCGTLKVNLQ